METQKAWKGGVRFNEKLREERQRRGLGINRAASEIGIPVSTLSRIERKERGASYKVAILIQRFLDQPLDAYIISN